MKIMRVVIGMSEQAFICSIIIFVLLFVFCQGIKFRLNSHRITVSRFGIGVFLDDYPWRINIK